MLFIGCSSNVIDEDDLIQKASLKYLNNNDKPYTGAISSKFENGKNEFVGQYKEGKRSGNWTFFYENGKIEIQGNLKDNKMVGEWFYYDEIGNVRKIIDCNTINCRDPRYHNEQ